MRRTRMILASLALVACSAPGTAAGVADKPDPAPAVAAPSAPRELVTGLNVPWGIAFLPGGDALVTERGTARLLRVTPQGGVTTVGTIAGVVPRGEGGLMGVAVSPDYATDKAIFVHFTAASDNRVVRYRYDTTLSDATPIITGIEKGANHNGGRLAFGPDGYLYVATGEVYRRELAQDKNSMAGKILRVTKDGRPAPGNPFGSRLWTLGHRNVQGLAWDEQGRMFATEFGQDLYDEVNRIEKGGNYGWPVVEGNGGDPRFVNPLITWRTSEASPSGLAYTPGSLWAAALGGRRLWQVPVTNGQVGTPVAHFQNTYGRLRAAVRAPDGSVWISTSNRESRGTPGPNDDRILVFTP
ncbi:MULTISPECIES: PQQ-dependent sugar dehydrogenase [Actinomadura]|uniref:PQQ-dependent sugar dehydrogenase n=1 Tax=Actinomadura yumaensis TaxID=111807 RepID=A0ABW2CJJ9_9ACTN|nr:PQQ-dependent sugar dehydrogenase [Actinomadura sp. J1-007]